MRGTISAAVALQKMNKGVPRSDRAPPRPPAYTSGILTFPLLNLSRWRVRRHRQHPRISCEAVCYHRPVDQARSPSARGAREESCYGSHEATTVLRTPRRVIG